jgi:hypothetical protein
MASTFSPNLRIELIGAGEQAGTWGTTTNTNLGTLIEDAISGYVAVTISSADQALTAVNGAADQSRNAMVQLNSASGAFSVYAPPESKQYVLFNNTAHAATIYNSTALGNTTAAGSGVTVPAGKTMTVWSDGTNFSVQNSLLAGDVVGNVTGNVNGQLSGTIASGVTGTTQTFGTNNTTIATTAFVQAALQALHPVGSIYINATSSTNPGTLFGFGTWTAFGAGRVPVGFNAADPLFDTAEETGGSKDATVVSHTHTFSATTSAAGVHTHTLSGYGKDGDTFNGWPDLQGRGSFQTTSNGVNSAGEHTHTVSGTTASTGSSGTNANLQPYITVYMWKRTA